MNIFGALVLSDCLVGVLRVLVNVLRVTILELLDAIFHHMSFINLVT